MAGGEAFQKLKGKEKGIVQKAWPTRANQLYSLEGSYALTLPIPELLPMAIGAGNMWFIYKLFRFLAVNIKTESNLRKQINK